MTYLQLRVLHKYGDKNSLSSQELSQFMTRGFQQIGAFLKVLKRGVYLLDIFRECVCTWVNLENCSLSKSIFLLFFFQIDLDSPA